MSHATRVGLTMVAAVAAVIAMSGTQAFTQTDVKPTNDLSNPYRTIENFFKLPEGRTWGSTSAVEIDKDGASIWVAERCGQNSCAASNLDIVLKFDASGKLVKSFGAGMMIFPHGIHVDKNGNVWVTDGQDNYPQRGRGAPPDSPLPPMPAKIIGHQVFKFSPDGKLLMTLGKPGGTRPGSPPATDSFYQPNDVITASNGDIFVAEGHGSATPIHRILKFTKDGKFIKEFGKKGTGPGEFDQPHALAMDSRGRLFVGDRQNNRVQIFDQDGKFIAEWKQFSRPSGLFIDKKDNIYSADSESESVSRNHDGWKRGIRIGSAKDGSIKVLIPDPVEKTTGTSAAEGVAVDSKGNIYGAEVGPRAVKKYVMK